MAQKIKAYFMRVDRESGTPYQGYFGEIENELRPKQAYVNFDEPGGLIQVLRMGDIDIICDDEGKLKNFPYNRVWIDDSGRVLDIFCGNIMCVRHKGDEFISIEESDKEFIETYLQPIALVLENAVIPFDEASLPEWSDTNN